MAERVASLFVEIGAQIDDAMRGMGQVRDKLGETKNDAGGLGDAFSSFASVATKAIGFVVAEGALLNQAFDFGRMGAQVIQTESAFNTLMSSLGQGPGILGQLRAATQGTVDDLSLMGSTNTLLIGTTGDLGAALAAASPELARIALAAHQVNPALGDTSFLYESLSRGIKRSQPLILDNLGIIVKMEEVYRDYAASIGKTADALTSEEKSMATLNAVLKSGSTIVEQAAAVNSSASVTIDRMQASVTNAGNAVKAEFAPAIAKAADGVYWLLTGVDQVNDALAEHAGEVATTSQTYTEYISELDRAADVAGYAINAQGDLVRIYQDMGYEVETVEKSHYALSRAEWEAQKGFLALGDALVALNGGLSNLDAAAAGTEGALGGLETATYDQERAWSAYGDQLNAVANESMGQVQIAAEALAAGIQGTLGTALDNYQSSMIGLVEKQSELQGQLLQLQSEGLPPTSQRYAELSGAIAENQQAQDLALESLQRTTAEMIYQQAAAGLDGQAALDLARSMGVLSESDYAVASAIEALRVQYDQNRDGAISAAEGAQQYAASVDLANRAVLSLQSKNMPVTLANIADEMQKLADTGAAGELEGVASAASEGQEPVTDFGQAASDAGGGADDLTGAVTDQNRALDAVSAAAARAIGGLAKMPGPLQDVIRPLRDAARAASDLDRALSSIQGALRVTVTTSGFSEAIGWVKDLSSALNNVPTSVTATVTVNKTSSTTPTGGTTPPAKPAPDASQLSGGSGGVTVNVYNPLAAAMLIEDLWQSTNTRYGGLMNG